MDTATVARAVPLGALPNPAEIQRALDAPGVRRALKVAPLHELMVRRKLVSKKAMREALDEYDVARHGTVGQYLVARGVIGQDKVDELAAEQKQLVVAEWETAHA